MLEREREREREREGGGARKRRRKRQYFLSALRHPRRYRGADEKCATRRACARASKCRIARYAAYAQAECGDVCFSLFTIGHQSVCALYPRHSEWTDAVGYVNRTFRMRRDATRRDAKRRRAAPRRVPSRISTHKSARKQARVRHACMHACVCNLRFETHRIQMNERCRNPPFSSPLQPLLDKPGDQRTCERCA